MAKTTLIIEDRLYRAVKKRAAEEGTTVTSVVKEALESFLHERPSAGGYKLPDGSFKGKLGLQPGIDLSNWEQIRDILYEGRGS